MVEKDVKKIDKFLERFDVCEVSEVFKNHHNTYSRELLSCWCEKEIIGFDDCNNALCNSALYGFKLTSAQLYIGQDSMIITMSDGEITITGIE